jgi:hypothetical protein
MASGEGLFSNMRKISPFMHLIGEGSTNAEKRRRAAQGDKKAAEEIAVEEATAASSGDTKQAPAMKRGGAVKKMASGGPVKKMPMPGDSVASGNRMSKMEADERRFMDSQKPKKKTMPSIRDSVDSGNRMSRMEGAEMRKMKYAKGGSVSSRADGCAVRGKTKGRMV